MIVTRRDFARSLGQLDPATIAAATPDFVAPPGGGFTLGRLFFTAVASGLTVWFITRWFDGGKR